MSIVIVDDFQMNANKPIDNRIVVGSQSFYKNKNSIDNKYNGLRIWDLNDNIPYYWNGATWSSENAIGVIVDSTPVNKSEVSYIPKFTSGATIIGKSKIYDNVVNIGIGVTGSAIVTNSTTTINLGLALNQNANETGLHVAGNIRTNRHFIGNGEYIQNINASNINGGVGAGGRLGIQWIQSKAGSVLNTDYVLINKNSVNTWEDFSAKVNSVISVSNINITDDTTSTTDKLLTFVSSTGNSPINVSTTKLKFRPLTGQLFLSDGSSTSPVYSFLNSLNTGMYYDNGNIGFTKQGINYVSMIDNGIAIKSSAYPQIQFINTTSNTNRLLWVSNTNDLLFRLDAGVVTTDKKVWHQDNLFTLKTLGDKSIETGRNLNITTTNAGTNDLIEGVYTYNVYNTVIPTLNTVSIHKFWSVISFGRGTNGSVQLASNWVGINNGGNITAERDIIIRSLRDTADNWTPWVKIWNSGNSGYVPFGAIMMWSGSTSQIPSGWRLCDGSAAVNIPIGSVPGQPSITSITIPDLRERFIVGAGAEPGKLVFDYGTSFTLIIPPLNPTQPYTFNVDTTSPYYIDTSGRLQNVVNTDGFSYHLYRGTNTNPGMSGYTYMVYDARYTAYVLIRGAFPAVGALATGEVKWMGGNKGGIVFYTTDSRYPLNNDTSILYNKYFTNGRRVAYTEIVWPVVASSGYTQGAKGGSDIVVLEGSQMTKHQHDSAGGESFDVTATYGYLGLQNNPGASDGDNYHYLTSAYGNNQPIENRPPYYALAFIIYTGV